MITNYGKRGLVDDRLAGLAEHLGKAKLDLLTACQEMLTIRAR